MPPGGSLWVSGEGVSIRDKGILMPSLLIAPLAVDSKFLITLGT